MIRHTALVAVSALALAALAGEASAHAKLVKSDPAANATVAAPKTITLTFDDELAPAFSKFAVTMPTMKDMAVKVKTVVSKDHKSIVGTPAAPLSAGAYSISWTAAAADDGHKTTGKVPFTVK
jgi:methionine-rich copper-binding protein CopC